MSRDFYPFVEEPSGNGAGQPEDAPRMAPSGIQHAARIAVYDDAAAAPRVVVIEPKPVREYLEEITSEVVRLSHEQGGTIPFMVIREIVENFIHAYFVEPTVSILDGGNTIRFSDQGPGIKEKARALEYGTSSATEEMRRYIRGVGSGLPYAQQYMADKGGSLRIDDNIGSGTVVTISLVAEAPSAEPAAPQPPQGWAQPAAPYPPAQPQNGWQQPGYAQPMPPMPGAYGQGWPQGTAACPGADSPYPQGYPAYPGTDPRYQQAAPASPYPPAQPWAPQQAPAPQPWPQQQAMPAQQMPPQPMDAPQGLVNLRISERGRRALSWIAQHEEGGPSNLARAYGDSQPTWSRELKDLESKGLVRKDGQKYRLTEAGQLFSQG